MNTILSLPGCCHMYKDLKYIPSEFNTHTVYVPVYT